MGHLTVYLLAYAINAVNAAIPIWSALGVIEGSDFPAPISTTAETFVDLIKHSNIFIDKSRIIEELFQTQEAGKEKPLQSFIRPSGWGKSVNLNLIKIFCEIQVDPKTRQIIPNDQTSAHRLFERGEIVLENGQIRKLRDQLLVSKNRLVMLNHQGQYIVVHMNLGGLKATSLDELKKGVAVRARLAFKSYDYDHIATSLGADSHVIDEMARRIRAENNNWTTFSEVCGLLKSFYKRDLIVLIEDYDDPLIELFGQSVPDKVTVVNQFLQFYTDFFKLFDDNAFFKKVVVTGTTRILYENQNQLIMKDIADEIAGLMINRYHGFNEKEIGMISDHLDISTKLRQQVTTHYSGYQFNCRERNTYNPLSVAKFLASRKLDIYWTPRRSIDAIFSKTLTIPIFRYSLLLMGVFSLCETKGTYKTSRIVHKEYLIKYRVEKLVHFLESPEDVIKNENATDPMLYYYFEAGLETAQYLLRGEAYLTRSYEVPNLEVCATVRRKLLLFYSSHLNYKGTLGQRNSSLHALCHKLGDFLLDDETRSDELNELFRNFLTDLREFNESMALQNQRLHDQDVQKIYVVSDALNFVAAYMGGFNVIHSGVVLRGEYGFVEGHLLFKRMDRAIIIQMIVGLLSVEEALQISRNHVTYIHPFVPSTVKRIGIIYPPDKNVTIVAVVDRIQPTSMRIANTTHTNLL